MHIKEKNDIKKNMGKGRELRTQLLFINDIERIRDNSLNFSNLPIRKRNIKIVLSKGRWFL